MSKKLNILLFILVSLAPSVAAQEKQVESATAQIIADISGMMYQYICSH